MARIQLYNQTTKKSGKIKLRFRLTDGRSVQLYHKSKIEAEISELSKFEKDGSPKKRANYNRELCNIISERMSLMQEVYDKCVKYGMPLTREYYEEEVDRQLHPEKYITEEEDPTQKLLLNRFARYIESGLFSDARKAGYWVTYRILERFLIITKNEHINYDEVAPDFIMNLREFMIKEWEYAKKKKWVHLYSNVAKNNFPDAPRAGNTVAVKLKMIQAFFRVLEDTDEIVKSPFRKIGRENRSQALREHYSEPISLTLEEVRKILNTDVPSDLQSTKEAFLIQCALGCRISDFKVMNMDSIAVSEEGIPYIHYLPKKTINTNIRREEIKTPIVRFAYDIVKRTHFDLRVLKNVSGKAGYNAKIKELLKFCEINREVGIYNEEEKRMQYFKLWEEGSSKLCRKTHVTLSARVQVNKYASGLHKAGSSAADHYVALQMSDLFILISEAFGEKPFKVNKEFEIIEEV
ncbi:MAG: hypothetical protein K2M45_01195 [Muribaculaceae bacterium]|nr:hypothetical protein [Muribaculaceae bacterium]